MPKITFKAKPVRVYSSPWTEDYRLEVKVPKALEERGIGPYIRLDDPPEGVTVDTGTLLATVTVELD